MDKQEKKEYQSSDRDTVVLLLTAGLPILRYFVDDNNKTQFIFDFDKSDKLISAMVRSELPNYPYDSYVRATRLFNSIVHSR